VLVGTKIATDAVGPHTLAVELPEPVDGAGGLLMLADVVVGQLLAFFHCLKLGQKPDTPSQGVLTRVVEHFPIHQDREGA